MKLLSLTVVCCLTVLVSFGQSGPVSANQAKKQAESKEEIQKMLPAPIIDNCAVGAIEIGLPMDSIYRFFAKKRIFKVYTYDATGKHESIQVVDMDGTSQYMKFEKECYAEEDEENNKDKKRNKDKAEDQVPKEEGICTIWRITVRTPNYYTKKNIKVGSTFRELKGKYIIDAIEWEEGNLVATVEMSNLSFFIDTKGISKSWYFTMSPALMPGDAKIVGIRITE